MSASDVFANGLQEKTGVQKGAGATTFTVHRNGKPIPMNSVRSIALHSVTGIKTGSPTADAVKINNDDIPDGKPVTVYADEFEDKSVALVIVEDDPKALPPPEDPDAVRRRRRVGGFVIRRGESYVIDVGTGIVTEGPAPDPAPEQQQELKLDPTFTPFVSTLFTHNIVGTNVNFCTVNAGLLSNVNLQQDSCNVKNGSSEVGISGGFLVRFLRNSTRLTLAGGRKPFGRNRPNAEGSRPPLRVTRDAVEEIVGSWVGGGVQLAGQRVYAQALAGMAYLTRDNSSTDTFFQSVTGQSQATTRTSQDKDTKPYVEVEAGFKILRGVGVGVVYSFTQFEDPQKKQNLHGTSVVLRLEPISIFR
jgi:hypothetical protein